MTIMRVRSGFTSRQLADALGPLAGLSGKWVGRGFNLISLPDFDKNAPSTGPQPFRALFNNTTETLEFVPGIDAPDRGSQVRNSNPPAGQNDIDVVGLRYLQTITDTNSGDPLHVEPGFWLNVPASDIPKQPASIVRQGSIPHGSCVLAIGSGAVSPTGKPDFDFQAPDSTPMMDTTPPHATPFGYTDPLFKNTPLPPPYTDKDKAIIHSPNNVLKAAFAEFGEYVTETTVLSVSTAPSGGVLNIPFLQNSTNNNAAATSMTAVFWIQTGMTPLGRPFAVLQYSQTVVLNFIGINWPHITVATLYKQ